jgi:hypothetical protein
MVSFISSMGFNTSNSKAKDFKLRLITGKVFDVQEVQLIKML